VFGQIARCRRLARLCRLRAGQEVVSYLGYTRSCRGSNISRDPEQKIAAACPTGIVSITV
jgi:hypothetical protein